MRARPDSKLGLEITNTNIMKSFGKDIRHMIQGRDKPDLKLFVGHFLTYEMLIDLNVFSEHIKYWVESNRNCTYIITPNNWNCGQGNVKIT